MFAKASFAGDDSGSVEAEALELGASEGFAGAPRKEGLRT